MDFIRKNWSRLSLALLFFIGGVIAVVAWINFPTRIVPEGDGFFGFHNIALLISTIVFFFGMVAVTIVKSLENSKKIVSIIYMCMGGIVTVLMLVLLTVLSIKGDPYTYLFFIFGKTAIDPIWGPVAVLYMFWVPTIVFGLYPLIKGITRFIEAEHIPAAVKQPAQPVAEAPAEEAPKAPAKKTASKTAAAK